MLLVGGESVIHAHLTLGQFTTFYLLLNMLISPMRAMVSSLVVRPGRLSRWDFWHAGGTLAFGSPGGLVTCRCSVMIRLSDWNGAGA